MIDTIDGVPDFVAFAADALTTETGAPLVIEPFQRTVLADILGPDAATEIALLVPKKNGKSSLLAALAMWHVLTVDFAECVVVAASRDQAAILLRQAHGLIRRSPALTSRLITKQREIVNPQTDGRIRVLASDSDTVDGQLPTLALVDELHRHKSADLYGILRDGIGPRRGQLVSISTAGDDTESPLGMLRAAAHALPEMHHDGAYRHVRRDGFAFHEYALEADDDLDDLALVKTANPASWIDLAEIERRHTSPSMRPWQWARFTCGVWMSGEGGVITATEWNACLDPATSLPDGTTGVVLGADFGWRRDATALVPMVDADGVLAVGDVTIIDPPEDGTATPVDGVKDALRSYADRYPGLLVVFDPWASGEVIAQWIDAELPGVNTAEHSQKPQPMALASGRIASAIAEGRVRYAGGPLTAHVLNAAAKSVGEGFRFVKQRGRGAAKIDGLIALAMGYSVMVGGDPEPKATFTFLD